MDVVVQSSGVVCLATQLVMGAVVGVGRCMRASSRCEVVLQHDFVRYAKQTPLSRLDTLDRHVSGGVPVSCWACALLIGQTLLYKPTLWALASWLNIIIISWTRDASIKKLPASSLSGRLLRLVTA